MHAAGRLGAGDPAGKAEGPADLRLVPPAIAAWAAAALALGAPARTVVPGIAVCCLAAAGALLLARRASPADSDPAGTAGSRPASPGHRRSVPVACALALLCAAAGATVAALHTAAVASGPLPGLAAQRSHLTAEVRITGDPRPARPRTGADPDAARPLLVDAETIAVLSGDGTRRATRAPVLLVVPEDRHRRWEELLPSTRLEVRARAAPPMPGRETDYAAVLRPAGTGPPAVTAPPGLHHRLAGRLRADLRDITDSLPADTRGMLPALVVGDTSRIPPGLHDAVRATDMTHLIVVSGAHLALVLAVLIGSPGTASRAERGGLAARLGIPLRLTALLGGTLVVAFVVLCRPGPSVLRAAVCGGIALLAIATGRRRSLLPALAAAALLLVLHDPRLARSFGFLLSVLATGALLTLAPVWSLALQRRRVPVRLAEALAAAGAAQVVCAPVVAVFSARVSLVAVPCNLLAQLAFAPALLLGWAALVTAPLLPPVAAAAAWLAGWPTGWIALIARTGASLPGAELAWPGGWTGAALLAAATVALLVLARPALRRPLPALGCALLLLLAVLRPAPLAQFLTGWPPPGWRLVACDVGQGDGLVVAAGPHTALVVDTGPDPAAMDDCLHRLGVRSIPLLILTHFHADHVAGLPGALRGREVGVVQTSSVRETPGQAMFVDRVARQAGVPVVPARPGEAGRLGEELSWEVLWPPEHAAGYGSNDASVTLLLRTGGLTVFLPGDLEPPSQQRLLAERPDLPVVDVAKVAHHGSAYQHPPLWERLRPRLALISAGEGNSYGHPAPSTVAALEAAGATVARTDRHGALAVTGGGPGELPAVLGTSGAPHR
ncbi:ComEC/Rec2 family competence protein [Streptomyces sodiiphilus]|uniref:ComEC/Rec2 family competence protein n=1 Tax=Streptomyces sodiiphilus TaxID=226217 RepID=A0ABP5AY83_9ACTN